MRLLNRKTWLATSVLFLVACVNAEKGQDAIGNSLQREHTLAQICEKKNNKDHPFRIIKGTVKSIKLESVTADCKPNMMAECHRLLEACKPYVIMTPSPDIRAGAIAANKEFLVIFNTKPDISLVKMQVGKTYEFCGEHLEKFEKINHSTRYMLWDQNTITPIVQDKRNQASKIVQSGTEAAADLKIQCEKSGTAEHFTDLVAGKVLSVQLDPILIDCKRGERAKCSELADERKPYAEMTDINGRNPFLVIFNAKASISAAPVEVGKNYEFCAERLMKFKKIDGSTRYFVGDTKLVRELSGEPK